MKSRSLLIHFPGFPFALETMMPSAGLASLAGTLQAAGYETSIEDHGTIAGLDALVPEGLRLALAEEIEGRAEASARSRVRGLAQRWQRRALAGRLMEQLERRAAAVSQELLGQGAFDFLLLYVPRRDDWVAALVLAKHLASSGELPRLLAAGPFVDAYAPLLAETTELFDAYLVGDAELALSQLAACIRDPAVWPDTPNVVLRCDGRALATRRTYVEELETLAAPVYGRAAYPAVHGAGKFKLWTVEHSRGVDHIDHTVFRPPMDGRRVRLLKPSMVCDRIRWMTAQLGARAFHLSGEGTPAAQMDTLAYEILARCLPIQYSRSGMVRHSDPATVSTWYSSGCRSCGFRIDTGSQRLLDDYYGHDFGVTETETLLRSCGAAGVYTVMEFTYPCPDDDYHTLAETVRLIRRCNPSAVMARLPELIPGSDWYDYATDFGFHADVLQATRWLLAPPSFLSTAAERLAFTIRGRSRVHVLRDHRDLLDELAYIGFAEGITPQEALVARLAGFDGQEATFHRRMAYALIVASTQDLSAMAAAFNDRATVPTNTVAFRPFQPARAAVGN